jgi:hypothetical protein
MIMKYKLKKFKKISNWLLSQVFLSNDYKDENFKDCLIKSE